jgi:hypothetical protein
LHRLYRIRAGHLLRAFLATLGRPRPGNRFLETAGSLQSGQKARRRECCFGALIACILPASRLTSSWSFRAAIAYPPCIVIVEVALVIRREAVSPRVPRIGLWSAVTGIASTCNLDRNVHLQECSFAPARHSRHHGCRGSSGLGNPGKNQCGSQKRLYRCRSSSQQS